VAIASWERFAAQPECRTYYRRFLASNSFYDALQLKVKAKIGSGGEIGGSYTWGKTIDTSSGSLVGDEYSNSISSPLWFNIGLNRGLADFNVAHNVEINYTYELSSRNGRTE